MLGPRFSPYTSKTPTQKLNQFRVKQREASCTPRGWPSSWGKSAEKQLGVARPHASHCADAAAFQPKLPPAPQVCIFLGVFGQAALQWPGPAPFGFQDFEGEPRESALRVGRGAPAGHQLATHQSQLRLHLPWDFCNLVPLASVTGGGPSRMGGCRFDFLLSHQPSFGFCKAFRFVPLSGRCGSASSFPEGWSGLGL